jgi:hemolysin activation/secretion protein
MVRVFLCHPIKQSVQTWGWLLVVTGVMGGTLPATAQTVQAPRETLDPSDVRQGNPNQQQPQSIPAPNTFQNLPTLQTAPPPEKTALPESGATVAIRKIEVDGSTVYPHELYLNDGYITTRAVLVDQEIVKGTVKIQVIEGKLTDIQIEGLKRLSPGYIRSRIRLGVKVPLRTSDLEDQLRLLRVDPLIASLEASLRASDKVGQSILSVKVTEAPVWGGTLGIDNYIPESVGGQRSRIETYYRNLAGNGETLSGSWIRSFVGGSNVFQLTYQQPVNARNGTVQFQTTLDRNAVTLPPFDALHITGGTESYELSFRQPVIRDPRQELGLSIAYRYQHAQTFVNKVGTQLGASTGASSDGTTRLGVIKFGQDFIRRDVNGAWAVQSLFSIGTGFPFAVTQNSGNIPDSHFFVWLGQVQRVQRVNDRNLMILEADMQLSTHSLLNSQQFVLGGGQSLRGYSQNLRSGDNGFHFSAENRFSVGRDANGRNVLQLAPFFDAGVVWQHSGNPNPIINGTFLAGTGLGVLWQPTQKLDVRFDWGLPLVEARDRVKDAFQAHGLYFNVNYRYP